MGEIVANAVNIVLGALALAIIFMPRKPRGK